MIPPKYNDQSEIVCDVKPGSNQLDFDLQGRLPNDRVPEGILAARISLKPWSCFAVIADHTSRIGIPLHQLRSKCSFQPTFFEETSLMNRLSRRQLLKYGIAGAAGRDRGPVFHSFRRPGGRRQAGRQRADHRRRDRRGRPGDDC